MQQLDTILNQKDVNITIFVSDDISKDKTLSIIKLYEDSRIRVLKSSERMGSASQNFFRLIKDVDFSNYDYIAFADQDDVWYEKKLLNAIHVLESKNIDVYSSNVVAFWSNGKKKLIDKSAKENKYDYIFGSAGPGCTIVAKQKTMMQFKKIIISKSNLIEEIDLHDWLFYAYIRAKNLKWFVDSNPSMDYRQHSNNEFGANSGLKSIITRWKKARNGWYRKQILLTAEFCEYNDLDIMNSLKNNRYLDRLKIIKRVFSLKKKKTEAIFLALILIVPGFK